MLYFTWKDIIDILLLAVVIYWLLKLTSKTRAMQVLKGLGIILVAAWVMDFLHLAGTAWILNYVLQIGALLIVIIFQPELRRALAKLGRGRIDLTPPNVVNAQEVVENILKAVLNLSKKRVGALIVFERKTGLKEVIESGTRLSAVISAELLENLFFTNSPLHDGAVIIREDTMEAAGCFLPLSDNKQIGQELGTRHRAALGISEVSDSVTLVISEETGVISVAQDGTLIRYLDSKAIRDLLEELYYVKQSNRYRALRLKRKGRDEREHEKST
ncbi:MAG: TIGR00159 family protein [Christensenellaceae bacterium]|nr:TIGR00159 family protein [Christensenellaceae bacterium]